ncbi:MAG: ABC transporter ATP-binding protein [Ignisphaera sp.]|nr:ABC transporter ATP-binding protein [Ignisphaera sp.]MCX8167708.1 ABC transporter ATP-binding protein [Ignisphaera sp.]MDW8085272.1 ABC transporter ATP-binding protein [Ignisphaera sp.]
MSNTLLEVKNVVKIFRYGLFGFEFRAVDEVSLSLEDKPFIFTVAGESGSGKTTLARIILGVHVPEYGEVLYRGRDIHRLKGEDLVWFRKEVQAVFQDPYATFNPLKKVYSYLYETAKNVARINESEIENHIEEVLKRVGLSLEKVKGKYPSEFSGGELQRVSIARALITKPRLILADEPVSMLDASLRVTIVNLFKEFRDDLKISFIYITHDLSTAYYISDYVAIMYRGWVVEQGPVDKVFIEPLHPYTQTLLLSAPVPDPRWKEKWLKAIKLTATIEEKEFLARGCKYVARCPHAMKKCFEQVPPEFTVNGVKVKCWLYER